MGLAVEVLVGLDPRWMMLLQLQLMQLVELKYKRHGSVKVGDDSAVQKKRTCRSTFLTDTEIKRHSTCTCMSNLI